MRVLIYSNMYPSKDVLYAGVFVKNQFEYLKKNYNEIEFEIKAMKKTNTNKLGSLIKYFLFILSSLPKLLNRYDILHVHYLSYHFLFALIYKIFHPGTKIFITFHGSDVNEFPENIFLRKLIKNILTLFSVRSICVGEKLAVNFQNKFFIKTDHILAAGVDDEVFYDRKNGNKNYDFIFVGSFTNVKGVDLLIEAILQNNLDLKWCFIGLGFYINDLKKLSKKIDLVIFNGLTQDEISIKLNESRYLIMPSRSEGFPLVSIEALYCGVPVLCSNIDQFKEQIIDGENGFVIEEYNANSINKTITKAHMIDGQEYSQLSMSASRSNKEHSLKNVCRKLVGIYEK